MREKKDIKTFLHPLQWYTCQEKFMLVFIFFFHTFRCFYGAVRFQTVIQHDPFYSFYYFLLSEAIFLFYSFLHCIWQFVLKIIRGKIRVQFMVIRVKKQEEKNRASANKKDKKNKKILQINGLKR